MILFDGLQLKKRIALSRHRPAKIRRRKVLAKLAADFRGCPRRRGPALMRCGGAVKPDGGGGGLEGRHGLGKKAAAIRPIHCRTGRWRAMAANPRLLTPSPPVRNHRIGAFQNHHRAAQHRCSARAVEFCFQCSPSKCDGKTCSGISRQSHWLWSFWPAWPKRRANSPSCGVSMTSPPCRRIICARPKTSSSNS